MSKIPGPLHITHYILEVELDPEARLLRVEADLTLSNSEPLDLFLGPATDVEELVAPEVAEASPVMVAGYRPWRLRYRTPPHAHLGYCFRPHEWKPSGGCGCKL